MSVARWVVTTVFVVGCASADKSETDGRATPAKELASGGARLRGGKVRMDVQVGRSLPTKPAGNARAVATPNATVTP